MHANRATRGTMLASAIAIATIVLVGCARNDIGTAADAATIASSQASTTTLPDTSTSPANDSTTEPATDSTPPAVAAGAGTDGAITGPIMPLTQSDDVIRLQKRLNDLKFLVGEPDGYYGDTTRAQVWAFQKVVLGLTGNDVTDFVSPELWDRMQQPVGVVDVRPDATALHINIDLTKQVLTIFKDHQLAIVSHISTGTGEEWCAIPRNTPEWPGATTTTNAVGRLQRVCGKSVTPGGVFEIYRRFRGKEEIPLGTVFDPVYFNSGIAIHGFDNVPRHPASHGCVRVPLPVGTQILNITKVGDQVFVFDGVQDPEVYGAQRPPFDEPDPSDKQFGKASSRPTKAAKPAP